MYAKNYTLLKCSTTESHAQIKFQYYSSSSNGFFYLYLRRLCNGKKSPIIINHTWQELCVKHQSLFETTHFYHFWIKSWVYETGRTSIQLSVVKTQYSFIIVVIKCNEFGIRSHHLVKIYFIKDRYLTNSKCNSKC